VFAGRIERGDLQNGGRIFPETLISGEYQRKICERDFMRQQNNKKQTTDKLNTLGSGTREPENWISSKVIKEL
jgi:hypothetical protein